MGADQEAKREAGDEAHGVDIDSLARQLREELAAADSTVVAPTGGCLIIIAEVGSLTRNVDAAEYDPHHVAIGPYHRIRNPDLAKDDEKIRCLNAVLSALSAGAAATTLEVYLDEIAGLEARARSCYAHSFSMDSIEFVRMLLLDACYLLVRFGDVAAAGRRRANGAAAAKGGATVSAPVAGGGGDMLEAVAVVRDVFYLAENQIPFFVLDKINQLTLSDRNSTVSAVDAIAGYVRELLRTQQYSVATPALAEPTVPGNLLHLLHMHLVPTVQLPPAAGDKASRKRRVGRWQTATEYHLAGVRFRSRPVGGGHGAARTILDVRFDSSGGTLEVPRLNIDAETWRLLRNLIALEQRNPEAAGSHVTAYCVFVSQLACTASDVEFLARTGVISHGLGNHGEVAAHFSDLCKDVVFSADDPELNYLRGICQALESGVRRRPRRWVLWLRRTHSSNLWLVLGLAAAVLGLVCTMVQAVYSVLSYRQGGR